MKYDSKFITGNNLPRDRATINAWCRFFAADEPIVQQVIEFYSTYPCKFLQVKYPNQKSINTFFKLQVNKLDLMEFIPEIIKQYKTLGECFVYSDLDESLKMWSRLIIQNPDYVMVKRGVVDDEEYNEISLRPDEKLRTLVLKPNPSENEIKEINRLSNSVIESIKNGKNIPLKNFYISSFIKLQSPYEIRGTSPLLPVLKSLVFLDKIRTNGKEFGYNLTDRYELEHEIKIALGHPDVFMKNDGGIRKEVAKTRISQTMIMMKNWMEKKIFAPISKMNDFYQYKNGQKELVIPKVTFDYKKFSEALDKDCSCLEKLKL